MSSTAQNKDSGSRSQLEIEQEEENRKIRRLQLMMNMVMSVLAQDDGITLEEASEMIANAKTARPAVPVQRMRFPCLFDWAPSLFEAGEITRSRPRNLR